MACFTVLAPWQFDKGEALDRRSALIDRAEREQAVPLEAVQHPDDILDPSDEWRRVTVRGHYVPGTEVLLRHRVVAGETVTYVLTPFRVAGAETVILVLTRPPPRITSRALHRASPRHAAHRGTHHAPHAPNHASASRRVSSHAPTPRRVSSHAPRPAPRPPRGFWRHHREPCRHHCGNPADSSQWCLQNQGRRRRPSRSEVGTCARARGSSAHGSGSGGRQNTYASSSRATARSTEATRPDSLASGRRPRRSSG